MPRRDGRGPAAHEEHRHREDDDATATLIAHFLTEAGMRWWRFSNGASAAQNLCGPHPRLRARVILLDINMPKLDGVEVLRRLKADDRYAAMPVIMLTTTDDPREVQRCYGLGCNVYITKPVDVDQLLSLMRVWLHA